MAYDLDPLSTANFPEKSNSDENGTPLDTPYPGLDTSLYYDADEYNRLAGAVIAHRTAVLDLDGRVGTLEGAGAPTSISDADGDTKVEVERTADENVVYVTAGGIEVATLSPTKQIVQSGVQTGNRAVLTATNEIYPGAPYPGVALTVAPDGSEQMDSSPAFLLMYGVEEASDSTGAMVVGASSGAASGTAPRSSLTTTASVTAGEASCEGTLSATTDAGTAFVTVLSQATGAVIKFQANGSVDIPFNDTGAINLPLGVNSIVDGITKALAAATSGEWAGTATAKTNVSSASFQGGRWSQIGNEVTCTGTVNVTPAATGKVEVNITPPVAFPAITNNTGRGGCAAVDIGAVQSGATPDPGMVVPFPSDTLLLVFNASTTSAHGYVFTLQYTVEPEA